MLGILTVVLPAIGFPSGWKTVFQIIIGVSICIVSLVLRGNINSLRRILKGREHTVTDSFVQSSHIDTYGKTRKSADEIGIKNMLN